VIGSIIQRPCFARGHVHLPLQRVPTTQSATQHHESQRFGGDSSSLRVNAPSASSDSIRGSGLLSLAACCASFLASALHEPYADAERSVPAVMGLKALNQALTHTATNRATNLTAATSSTCHTLHCTWPQAGLLTNV